MLDPLIPEEGHGQPALYVHPIADGKHTSGLRWWLYSLGADPTPQLAVVGWINGAYVSVTQALPGGATADIPGICEGVAADARGAAEAKALRNQAPLGRLPHPANNSGAAEGTTPIVTPLPNHTELGASSG